MIKMHKTREQLEQEIYASAPLLFRWKSEGYIEPEDIFNEEDLALHKELGITAEPPRTKFPTIHYYGIECGDGWLPLIKEATTEIEYLLNQYLKSGSSIEQLPVILQIKEKFGLLRIAIRGFEPLLITPEIRKIIDETEKLSKIICENCGVGGLDPERTGMNSRCKNCK